MDLICGRCGHYVHGEDWRIDRGDCRLCWLAHNDPIFQAKFGDVPQAKDWPPPGFHPSTNGMAANPGLVAVKPDLSRFRRGICPHQGAQIGETPCDECGLRGTPLPLMACDLHGKCTQEHRAVDRNVVFCQRCDDHPEKAGESERIAAARAAAKDNSVERRAERKRLRQEKRQEAEEQARTGNVLSVNLAANGIGDALLGLVAVAGLAQASPGKEVVYKAPGVSHQWLRLFDGYDRLEHHQPPPSSASDQSRQPLPGDLEMNKGYFAHREDREGPRWLRYCRNIGAPGPALPALRDRQRLLDLGREWAGAVVLAPFSVGSWREWKIENWHAVVRLLKAQGFRVVAVHSVDSFGNLDCEHHHGLPAEQVAGMMLNAACVIGVDSGPMHFAGALGVPAVAVCGSIPGGNVFGVWPTVKVVQVDLKQEARAEEVVAALQRRTVVISAPAANTVRFFTPTGIGDCVWALTKMRAIAGDRMIEVVISGNPGREIDNRTPPFLRRFRWIGNASILNRTVLERGARTDRLGRYRLLPDGMRDGLYHLMPNKALEAGIRLEDWLPDVPIDWNVMDSFDWSGTQKASALGKAYSPFVALYLGPEEGNTVEGHNRGPLWTPRQWVQLGRGFHRQKLNIVVVGASYDRSYWEKYVRPLAEKAGLHWLDAIGKWEIGSTFAFLRQAKCLISYQCGLGIVSHYLGVPVAMWWRQDGDSAHPRDRVCFDERMAHCWTRPEPQYQQRYLPLYYGRQTPEEILAIIEERGWLR